MKSTIRNTLIATVTSALIAGGAMQVYAQSEQATTRPTLAIPLIKALEIAQSAVPGEVRGAELETDESQSVWEIEILDANGQEIELEIDAADGSVLSQKVDDEKDGDDGSDDDRDDDKDDEKGDKKAEK